MSTKKLNYILIFSILIGAISCTIGKNSVTFLEAQPKGKNSLSCFPAKLQGIYIYSDIGLSSTLSISDSIMHFSIRIEEKDHKSKIDSTTKALENELIEIFSLKFKTTFITEGDSVIMVMTAESLIQLSHDIILKKCKNYYFLNIKDGDDGWGITKIGLAKGLLSFSNLSTQNDLSELKRIADNSKDTVHPYIYHQNVRDVWGSPLKGLPYKFNLTKKQFKKFIKHGGFSQSETFTKQ